MRMAEVIPWWLKVLVAIPQALLFLGLVWMLAVGVHKLGVTIVDTWRLFRRPWKRD